MVSKLNGYFDAACFAPAPIIGADGKGTGFGNSSTGITNGPGQANLDLALAKVITLGWPHDESAMEIRLEFFNALNHPQFANPDANFSSPTFGVIASTAVNPPRRTSGPAIQILSHLRPSCDGSNRFVPFRYWLDPNSVMGERG